MIRIYVHISLGTTRILRFEDSTPKKELLLTLDSYLSYTKFIVGMGFSRDAAMLTKWNILRETSLFPLVCPNTDIDFYEM